MTRYTSLNVAAGGGCFVSSIILHPGHVSPDKEGLVTLDCISSVYAVQNAAVCCGEQVQA